MNEIYKESNQISVDFYIYTINKYKKYVGSFKRKDKVFRKDISTQHIFHEANSFGIDAGLVPELDKLGCVKIILKYTVNGHYFSIDYKKFLTKGWEYPKKGQKVKGIFQSSFVVARKYWRERDKFGNIIYEPQEGGDEYVESTAQETAS